MGIYIDENDRTEIILGVSSIISVGNSQQFPYVGGIPLYEEDG